MFLSLGIPLNLSLGYVHIVISDRVYSLAVRKIVALYISDTRLGKEEEKTLCVTILDDEGIDLYVLAL